MVGCQAIEQSPDLARIGRVGSTDRDPQEADLRVRVRAEGCLGSRICHRSFGHARLNSRGLTALNLRPELAGTLRCRPRLGYARCLPVAVLRFLRQLRPHVSMTGRYRQSGGSERAPRRGLPDVVPFYRKAPTMPWHRPQRDGRPHISSGLTAAANDDRPPCAEAGPLTGIERVPDHARAFGRAQSSFASTLRGPFRFTPWGALRVYGPFAWRSASVSRNPRSGPLEGGC